MRIALLLLLTVLVSATLWLFLFSPTPAPPPPVEIGAETGQPTAAGDPLSAPEAGVASADPGILRNTSGDLTTDPSGEEVKRAGAISGLVLDPGGNPLPGASVAFLRRAPNGAFLLGLDHTAPVDRLLRTDSRGRYSVADLPAGGSWDLCAWHGEFCFATGSAVDGLAETAQELPPIQLGDGYVVEGRVTDEQSTPLVGVALDFRMEGWQPLDAAAPTDPLGRYFQTVSEDDGSFQFSGMGDGAWTLRARLAGRGDGWIHPVVLLPRQQAPSLNVVMGPEFPLSGVTRTSEGQPLPATRVNLEPSMPGLGPGFDLASDAEGRFSFRGVPEGAWILTARHPGFLPARPVELDGSARTDLVLELSAIGAITGKLLARDGRAPASATIQLWSAIRGVPPYQPLEVIQNVSDPEGNFELALADPGTFVLLIRAAGHAPAWSPLFQAHPQATDLGTIRLRAAASVAGRLVAEPDLSPVAGARITVRSPAWDPTQAGGPFAALMTDATDVPPVTSRTAADGSFALEGLPLMPCLLVFEHSGVVTHTLTLQLAEGERQDLGEVRAQAASSLTILGLDEDGTPLSGGNVLLQRDEAGFDQSTHLLDAEGRARIGSLAEGDCWISVIEGGGLFGRSSPRQHLWIAPGTHQNLEIRLEAPR